MKFRLFVFAIGALLFGAPVKADQAVSVGAGIRYICQTSAPAPIGRARDWVRCSDGHRIYTTANNADIDLMSSSSTVVANVQQFGALANGVHDDTFAIQSAVTAAQLTGGTVYFPVPGRYVITSQIVVSSLYPVNLISDMYGYSDNVSTGNFIMPGANLGSTSMIRYQAPGGSHGAHGAGMIRGLAFYDPFNAPGHTGNFSMLAALDLYDFNLGSVQDCMFHVLNGGAIRTVFMVMGSINNIEVRYSGTTTQPAFSAEGISAGVTIQSTSITNSRFEVNYGTYISLNANSIEVKLANIGMEADTTVSVSNNTMILNAGVQNFFSSIHLNRNNTTQWNDTGNQTQVSNLTIADNSTKTTTTPSMLVSGSESEYHNVHVRGATASTVAQVQITSTYGRFFGIDLASSGGVSVATGSFNQLYGVTASSINTGSGTAVIDISAPYTNLVGCMVNTPPVNEHGVRVTGTPIDVTVSNCTVYGSTGTGSSFRDENASNATIWSSNHSKSSTTNFSASATAYIARGNDWAGIETETVAGNLTISGKLNGTVMAAGAVLDNANTAYFGATLSTAQSIGRAGTTATLNGATVMTQGLAPPYRSATTPITLAVTDYFVGIGGSGARAVTLPAASTCVHAGQQFMLQEIGGSTGVITITRAGSDTINGGTSLSLAATAYGRQMLVCDGTSAWYADTTTL